MSINNLANLLRDKFVEMRAAQQRTYDLIELIYSRYKNRPKVILDIVITQNQDLNNQEHPYMMKFTQGGIVENTTLSNFSWFTGEQIVYGKDATLEWSSPGMKSIILTAETAKGKKVVAERSVFLTSAAATNISLSISVNQPPPNISNNYNAQASATASTTRGEIVRYDWYVEGSLVAPNAGPNPTLNLIGSGNRSVGCMVTDSTGNQMFTSITINVESRSLVLNFTVTPSGYSAPENNGTLYVSASASSNAGGIESYTWELNGNVVPGNGATNTITNVGYGARTVKVTARDTAGNTANGSVVINVEGPSQQGTSFTPNLTLYSDYPGHFRAMGDIFGVSNEQLLTSAELGGTFSYEFNFAGPQNGGDTKYGRGSSVSTSYEVNGLLPGLYTVTLVVVSEASGKRSQAATSQISVAEKPKMGLNIMTETVDGNDINIVLGFLEGQAPPVDGQNVASEFILTGANIISNTRTSNQAYIIGGAAGAYKYLDIPSGEYTIQAKATHNGITYSGSKTFTHTVPAGNPLDGFEFWSDATYGAGEGESSGPDWFSIVVGATVNKSSALTSAGAAYVDYNVVLHSESDPAASGKSQGFYEAILGKNDGPARFPINNPGTTYRITITATANNRGGSEPYKVIGVSVKEYLYNAPANAPAPQQ